MGLHALGTEAGPAEVYLYVPASYLKETPAPFVLLLHGARENAHDGLAQLRGQADGAGLVLLAPGSRGPAWDSILNRGRYGPDVAAIDRTLEYAFSRCAVDLARVAVGGYSDGASYALSLGMANGDLFAHVLAFSPGFLTTNGRADLPGIFVSHGTRDGWLPIGACSRRIVPHLDRAGYEVRYREFEGTWSRPGSRGRRRVGSSAGTEGAQIDNPRAAEPLRENDRRSEQRRPEERGVRPMPFPFQPPPRIHGRPWGLLCDNPCLPGSPPGRVGQTTRRSSAYSANTEEPRMYEDRTGQRGPGFASRLQGTHPGTHHDAPTPCERSSA